MVDYTILTTLTLAIALILWIYFGPIAGLRRDNFRSDIRRIRDDLFDFMWETGCDYSNPSYVRVRRTLNGMLRMSNWADPIVFFLAAARSESDEPVVLIDERNPDLRKQLNAALEDAYRRLLVFVFMEGVWGAIIKSLRALHIMLNAQRRFRAWATRRSKPVLQHAYLLEGIRTQYQGA